MSETAVLQHESAGAVRDYLELAKARVISLILVVTAAGFLIANPFFVSLPLFALTLLGTALVAAGTNGFNQIVEQDADRLMDRTRRRPLPAGRLTNTGAITFSIFTIASGFAVLAIGANLLSALLALTTTATYLLFYTPLKRRTSLATIAGAVPGAIPPMIGWSAATGSLTPGAWMLFALLFVWQLPHFFAIGHLYRDDYRKGGFRLLCVVDEGGRQAGLQAVLYSLILLPLTLAFPIVGIGGPWTAAAAFTLSIFLVVRAFRFHLNRSRERARSLFMGSNVYLLLVMIFAVAGTWLAR